MGITNKMWELGTLLENIGEARNGNIHISPGTNEKDYINDVKKRVPKIEKALDDLKKYLAEIDS
jgi:hypothetical protein